MTTILALCFLGALIAFVLFVAFVLLVKYLLPKEEENEYRKK